MSSDEAHQIYRRVRSKSLELISKKKYRTLWEFYKKVSSKYAHGVYKNSKMVKYFLGKDEKEKCNYWKYTVIWNALKQDYKKLEECWKIQIIEKSEI